MITYNNIEDIPEEIKNYIKSNKAGILGYFKEVDEKKYSLGLQYKDTFISKEQIAEINNM